MSLMRQRYYSNIYWHFTGSSEPSADDRAVDTVAEILRTRKLLATSSEQISEMLRTNAFCCVTDVPLKDLFVHARRYGRAAIGFKASVIHRRFGPVLYVPKENLAFYQGLIPEAIASIGNAGGFLDYLKMTRFSEMPEETYYAEREWRHIGDFNFEQDAVQAIIAPAAFLPQIRRELFDQLGYPETISVVSWEFIENA